MSTNLHTVVVAELDRLERLYGGDREDGRHAALSLVVEMHQCTPGDPHGLSLASLPYCKGCNGYWTSGVCKNLRTIAEALGIDAGPVEGGVWDGG